MCNSASDSSDLNGDGVAGVAVGDAGGRCCTCTIGFDILKYSVSPRLLDCLNKLFMRNWLACN